LTLHHIYCVKMYRFLVIFVLIAVQGVASPAHAAAAATSTTAATSMSTSTASVVRRDGDQSDPLFVIVDNIVYRRAVELSADEVRILEAVQTSSSADTEDSSETDTIVNADTNIDSIHSNEEEELVSPSDGKFYVYAGTSLALVLLGGLMSGLTVGLFSIDPLRLQLIINDQGSSDVDRERAKSLAPLLSDHHKLLVTLLLANATAMETLPLMLDKIVPSYIAILLSVTFVLLFGEIIPQALCTKDPLGIGARFAGIVKVLMYTLYIIVWPIAWLLDRVLGDEGHHFLYTRSELYTLVGLHADAKGGDLMVDETNVIQGALDMRYKTAADSMTEIESVYMVHEDTVLTANKLAEIMGTGHSRIPVYASSRHDIRGILLVKRLIALDPNAHRVVKEISYRPCVIAPKTMPLYLLINIFQKGHSHMAIVVPDAECVRVVRDALASGQPIPKHVEVLGVVTLEDLVEELIQEEILDEVDFGERAIAPVTGPSNVSLSPASRPAYVNLAVERFKALLHRHHVGTPPITMATAAVGVAIPRSANSYPANVEIAVSASHDPASPLLSHDYNAIDDDYKGVN
jgi:metal transporter CNNM